MRPKRSKKAQTSENEEPTGTGKKVTIILLTNNKHYLITFNFID